MKNRFPQNRLKEKIKGNLLVFHVILVKKEDGELHLTTIAVTLNVKLNKILR